MKKESLEVLEPSKILHLEDITKYPYLKQNLKIRFYQKFQEDLWNKSKDKINCTGNINKWYKLSKLLKVNINSIMRFNERSAAKPIEIYEKLLNLLEYNITWGDLEKNTLNLVLVKNKLKVKFPLRVADLGLIKLKPIKVNVPRIKWEILNKNPITTFKLKDFIKKIEIKNPYFNSKNKKHNPFKKIGRKYKIDLTKKVYIHLNNIARKELFDKFYRKIPGINFKIKQKNATYLLNYYRMRSLETIYNRDLQGIPFIILLKVINYINNKKYNLNWLQRNLEGISSGERTYHKIKFPIKWKNKDGIIILSSFLGDGGLGFRSTMWAWAVPHYAQFSHKELLEYYIKAIKNIYGISIKKKERLELPAVCGYIVVASGYFMPGHKSYTDPQVPKIIKNLKLLITCINWIISDDGTFNRNHLSITSGSHYLDGRPLNYINQLRNLIQLKLPWININIIKNKDSTHAMSLTGGFYSMKKLNDLFKKYNGGIYANKKQILLQNYLNNRYFNNEDYNKRYKRFINVRL